MKIGQNMIMHCSAQEVVIKKGNNYIAGRTKIRSHWLNFQERKEERKKTKRLGIAKTFSEEGGAGIDYLWRL